MQNAHQTWDDWKKGWADPLLTMFSHDHKGTPFLPESKKVPFLSAPDSDKVVWNNVTVMTTPTQIQALPLHGCY